MLKIFSRMGGMVRNTVGGFFERSTDPLLRGDVLAYAEREYPRDQYPTAWTEIPEDVRHGLEWDGKLLNGRDVAELAKGQLTDEHVSRSIRKAGRRALFFTVAIPLVLGAVNAAITYGGRSFGYDMGRSFTPYPLWAEEAGAWLPVLSWYALAGIERLWTLAATVIAYGPPLIALFFVFWYFGFVAGMSKLWGSLSEPLRVATRDAAVFWKTNMTARANDYHAYKGEVLYATTALAGKPVFGLGRATGLLAARGDRRAPSRGQLVAVDAESIRQHGIFLGATGSRKTTLGIIPLFQKVVANAAVWGENHKIGSYVTDGKGGLWRDLMEFVADRDDVRVIGTADGQYGVDLIEGMTPSEVASTFKAVGGQIAGKNTSDDFWAISAATLIMHAATIAQALEFDAETVAEWVDEKAIRPYSLLGIALLATEEAELNTAVKKLKENGPSLNLTLSEPQKLDYRAAYDSAAWFIGYFFQMAKDTRSGIVANVNAVLGQLQGEREIARRFCGGTFDRTIDVDHALKGGVVMVALGAQSSLGSKLVTVWLKTRLYILAMRRYEANPEDCKNTSCLMIADEFQSLVTQGQDSDQDFWNRARSSGLFMWAATQSLAAIEQIIGNKATENLMDCLRTKIVLATKEVSTLEYCRKLAGDAPRGMDYDNLYSTQAARQMALGDEGEGRVSLGFMGGLLPRFFRASTHQNQPYTLAGLVRGLPRSESKDAGNSMRLQLATRNEDRNRAAFTEGVTDKPKLDMDDLRLGSGLAFALVMRAGGDRMDIIDMTAA